MSVGQEREGKERYPNASIHMWRPEDSLREETHYLLPPCGSLEGIRLVAGTLTH